LPGSLLTETKSFDTLSTDIPARFGRGRKFQRRGSCSKNHPPGTILIKLFAAVIYNFPLNLECLFKVGLSGLILGFRLRLNAVLKGRFPQNKRLVRKGLPGTNLNLLLTFIKYSYKRFYSISPRCQCYKTFYSCHLQIFR